MKSEDPEGNLIFKEQIITVRVEVEELPIYVKDKIIDLKCTLFNRTYRKKVEIFNRSKTACKVDIKVPQIFLKFIEVSPTMVFVQANGSQTINIKITPTLNMLKELYFFSILKEDFINTATMLLPIEIKVREIKKKINLTKMNKIVILVLISYAQSRIFLFN